MRWFGDLGAAGPLLEPLLHTGQGLKLGLMQNEVARLYPELVIRFVMPSTASKH